MILEEETFEKFKHYPSKLTHGSTKPILASCDDCGKVRETSKHDYHPLCKSCAKRGKNHPMFNKQHSEETKALMSEAHEGKKHTEEHNAHMSAALKGEKCYNWQGGISFEPYCIKFNDIKEPTRAKFGYTCFLCHTTQEENGRALCVHHVNYNKNCGCDDDKTCRFVPLCMSCHSKTNSDRDYWQALITEMLKPFEAWE